MKELIPEASLTMRAGGNWNWMPEDPNEMIWIPYRSASGGWMCSWNCYGGRITNGVLQVYRIKRYGHVCNSTPIDAVLADIPALDNSLQLKAQAGLRQYCHYVLSTGGDPLDVFPLPLTSRKVEYWQVRVDAWKGMKQWGLEVTECRTKKGGQWLGWKRRGTLSNEARAFLGLNERNGLERFKSFPELRTQVALPSSPFSWHPHLRALGFRVHIMVPPQSRCRRQEERMRMAQKCLKGL